MCEIGVMFIKKYIVMKKIFISMMLSSLLLGVMSCTDVIGDSLNTDANEQGDFILHATYKGISYEVPGKLDKDGNPVYLNKEFSELYKNELSNHPTLVTVLRDGDIVEYYESLNEVLDVNNMQMLENSKIPEVSGETKGTAGTAGRVIVWDDSNYSDRSLTFDITYSNWWAIPQLRNYNNFNDKISSLKIWSYINPSHIIEDKFGCRYSGSGLRITFIGYENDNYEGKVLLCLCSPQGTHFDHRLGNIGWNDKITALRVLISDANSSTDRKYYNINLDEHSHGSLADGWLGTLGYPAITPYTAH